VKRDSSHRHRLSRLVPYDGVRTEAIMFEADDDRLPQNNLGDWVIRGGIALFFLLFGFDKFSSSWTKLFDSIGFCQWFRIFTGIVEIAGAILVLIPKPALYGLCLLAATMAGAALTMDFVVRRPGDSVMATGLLVGLLGYIWARMNR